MFAGRKVVLAGGPLAASTVMCRRLRELGAERPFVLATGTGTGELPHPDEADWCVVELRAPDVMSEIRKAMRLLRLLPSTVVEALDRWDPERRAVVLSPMFNELPEIAGRRVYGPRRPAWRRLEDKVVVDALWDDLGIMRAPSAVVAAEAEALWAAARRLDRGAGTAWAGDARQGFHGGASVLRWVRGVEDVEEAAAFLGARCDRVRVMPFLEGIPCSIHGVVFPGGVAAFRPVEMVTLRQPGSSRLRYAGAATFWDPPPADREVMRDLARRAGEGLRERVGYRGAFTVDGVLTAEGFLPTELNPRLGAGLSAMTRDVPELPVALLDRALVEGEPLTLPAAELERQVLDDADRTRAGGAWTVTTVTATATPGPAGGVRRRRVPPADQQAGAARRALVRPVGGGRVRATGPRPRAGARRAAGSAARRGRVRPGRRALRDRHRPAGTGPPGPVNAATRPRVRGARRRSRVPG